MTRPSFKTLKDARAWLNEDAIAGAILPFRPLLSAAGLEDLVEYLEIGIATHPELRKLATRAAKSLVPRVVVPLLKAARKIDEEEAIPLGPSAEVARFEPGLVGKPDLNRADFRGVALSIIKALAKCVATRWGRTDVDDMIGQGWLVAVQITPGWEATKASYQCYLWARVRGRLIDYAKRACFRRERPVGMVWAEEVHASQFSATDPEGQFREAVNADATSHFLGLTTDPEDSPEAKVIRMCDLAAVRTARATLPERQQKLMGLLFDEEVPFGVAAATLGVSQRTGHRDLNLAVTTLQGKMLSSTNVRALRPQPPVHAPVKRSAPGKSTKRAPLRLVKPRKPDDADD